MTQLVIFDCDGVLVNTEEILLKTEIDFVESYTGSKINIADYVAKYTGLAENLWLEAIYNLQDPAIARKVSKEALNEFKGQIDKVIEMHMSPIQGIETFLTRIIPPVAVASNSTLNNLIYKLEKTNLLSFFKQRVFSADMVEKGKPAPDLFLHAAKTASTLASECVVIEDSSNGIIAAKKAGMIAIGFVGGGHCHPSHQQVLMECGADGIISSYDQDLDPRTYSWLI